MLAIRCDGGFTTSGVLVLSDIVDGGQVDETGLAEVGLVLVSINGKFVRSKREAATFIGAAEEKVTFRFQKPDLEHQLRRGSASGERPDFARPLSEKGPPLPVRRSTFDEVTADVDTLSNIERSKIPAGQRRPPSRDGRRPAAEPDELQEPEEPEEEVCPVDLSDRSTWLHPDTRGKAAAFERLQENGGYPDGLFMVEASPGDDERFIINVNFRNTPTRHLVEPNAEDVLLVNREQYGTFTKMEDLLAALMSTKNKPAKWRVRLDRTVPVPQSAYAFKDGVKALIRTSIWVHHEAALQSKEEIKEWAYRKVKPTGGELTNSDTGRFIVRCHSEDRGLYNLCLVFNNGVTLHNMRVDPEGTGTMVGKKHVGDFKTVDAVIGALCCDPIPPNWPVRLTRGVQVGMNELIDASGEYAGPADDRATSDALDLDHIAAASAVPDPEDAEALYEPVEKSRVAQQPVPAPTAAARPYDAASDKSVPLPSTSRWVHVNDDLGTQGSKEAVKTWATALLGDGAPITNADNGKFVVRSYDWYNGLYQLCLVHKAKLTIHAVFISANDDGKSSTINKKHYGSFTSIDDVVSALAVSPGPVADETGKNWPAQLREGLDSSTLKLVLCVETAAVDGDSDAELATAAAQATAAAAAPSSQSYTFRNSTAAASPTPSTSATSRWVHKAPVEDKEDLKAWFTKAMVDESGTFKAEDNGNFCIHARNASAGQYGNVDIIMPHVFWGPLHKLFVASSMPLRARHATRHAHACFLPFLFRYILGLVFKQKMSLHSALIAGERSTIGKKHYAAFDSIDHMISILADADQVATLQNRWPILLQKGWTVHGKLQSPLAATGDLDRGDSVRSLESGTPSSVQVREMTVQKMEGRKIGLSFVEQENGGGVKIKGVHPDGLAFETGVASAGMTVIAVNGHDTSTATRKEVLGHIKMAQESVTFTLVTPNASGSVPAGLRVSEDAKFKFVRSFSAKQCVQMLRSAGVTDYKDAADVESLRGMVLELHDKNNTVLELPEEE